MYIIWTTVIGFIAGAIAKLLMPGKDPGGFILTTLLGIGGAVVAISLRRLLVGIEKVGLRGLCSRHWRCSYPWSLTDDQIEKVILKPLEFLSQTIARLALEPNKEIEFGCHIWLTPLECKACLAVDRGLPQLQSA
jgi:uncharacterized membrane protein YeaQ/YmgE (transglycosylase-associated protein family)